MLKLIFPKRLRWMSRSVAGQVGATVNVTDTSGAAVDTTQNTTGTNVSSEQFSNFPTQRTVQSLVQHRADRSSLRSA